MMHNRFTKIFVATLAFTAVTWTMAWVFSAMAGETPKTTVSKLKDRLNQGELVEESEKIDFTGIQKVLIESGSRDVKLVPVMNAEGLVEFAGQLKPGPGKVLQVERNGDQLIVRLNRERAKGFVWNFDDDDNVGVKFSFVGLKVALPANLVKTVEVRATSGDIELEQIQAAEIELAATSGDISLTDCKGKGSVRTTSGDIEVKNFDGKLRAASTSGEIEADKVSGEELEVSATSGDVELNQVDTQGLRANVTSGDISVRLNDGTGWKFRLSAKSGETKNDWSDDTNGNKMMNLNSTSGDIRVSR